jgi:hypothetical protein
MPKMITYRVQLTPAEIDADGVVSFVIMDPGTREYLYETDNLAKLQGEIRALVADVFRQTAVCWVRPMPGAKKPPGFDRAMDQVATLRYVAPTPVEV